MLLLASGCTVADIDFTGKTCSAIDPCPMGWSCTGGQCSVACGYNVSNLLAASRSPNSIRWEWQTAGVAAQLDHFELELVTDGGTRVWTRDDSPELGTATLGRGGGARPVRSTLTRDHAPSTSHAAELRAINLDGCVSRATAVAVTGPPPTNPGQPIAFFDDVSAPGFSIPTNLDIVAGGGAVSGRHLEYRPATDPSYADAGILVGFQNLRRSGLPAGLIVRPATTQFATAYLEVYIRYAEGEEPGWFSESWLRTYGPDGGADCGDPCVFVSGAFTLPVSTDGSYRRFQFPLTSFSRRTDGGALTSNELANGVDEVKMIGSSFTRNAVVSIDGVRIWY